MHFSEYFIRRPIATSLLMAGFVLHVHAQGAGQKPLVFSDYKQQTPGTIHKITAPSTSSAARPRTCLIGNAFHAEEIDDVLPRLLRELDASSVAF